MANRDMPIVQLQQIIPAAPGFRALYFVREPSPGFITQPIIAWYVTVKVREDEDISRSTVGITPADDGIGAGYDGILYPDGHVVSFDQWFDDVRDWCASEARDRGLAPNPG